MQKPVVVGRPIASRILLIGQAPGPREPQLGRPFAWTAGRTLFRWLESALGWDEETARDRIYFAAVCRCFLEEPTRRRPQPDKEEIERCSSWLHREFELLQPRLVLPVGRLAIEQFLNFGFSSVIGRCWGIRVGGGVQDLIPLPHPSGASTWHRSELGKTLLERALSLIANHSAVRNALHESTFANTARLPSA